MGSESLVAIGQEGAGLCVEFRHRGDRYGHVISLVQPAGKAVPLLESVEGLPSEDWPASPPLQSLHLQEMPSGRWAALLVGMAGRSHWSASVEAAAGRAELTFDVACRTGSDGWLGSKYRWLDASAMERIVIVAGSYQTGIESAAGGIAIESIAKAETAPRTVRWMYRLRLARSGEGRMMTRP
jgi:hypothetical protein